MMGLLRSELRKLTTGRTILVLTVVGLGLVAVSASFGLFATDLVGPFTGSERQVAEAIGSLGGNTVIVLIVGILSVTTEFRHGTIGRTLQLEPSRTRVLTAKLIAAVGYAVGFTALALVVVAALVAVAASGAGVSPEWGPEAARALWQAPVGFALNAMLGVAVGALLRSQVIAMTVTLVWLFVVESLVVFLLPSVGRFLPFQALAALFADATADLVIDGGGGGGGMGFGVELLDPGVGLTVFLGYVVVACVAAGVHLTRGDV
jgi:ABC-2 type transport system permease protein